MQYCKIFEAWSNTCRESSIGLFIYSTKVMAIGDCAQKLLDQFFHKLRNIRGFRVSNLWNVENRNQVSKDRIQSSKMKVRKNEMWIIIKIERKKQVSEFKLRAKRREGIAVMKTQVDIFVREKASITSLNFKEQDPVKWPNWVGLGATYKNKM